MKLKNIKFRKSKYNQQCPKKITVSMSVEEALWIAMVAGKQRGGSTHSGIYESLVGDVFNRYWDNGVNDAMREHYVEIPPIVYSKESGVEND